MNCIWKSASGIKGFIFSLLSFFVYTFFLSIIIKLIASFLDLFSKYHAVNAIIVIASVTIVLVSYVKCCPKSKE